jgi:hypothetical protein
VGWGPIDRIDGADASDIPHTEDPVQVGLDGTGNGLALWDGVFAVRFTPGTGWGPPERLSVGGAAAVLSVAPAGPAFAAWVSERLVVQRFDPAQGWGPQTRFAPEDGWRFTSRSSLALDERGRALLAWTRQRSVEYSVWAAAYESERWTALGQLNSALKTACCQLVGLAGNGHGLAVWKHLGGDVGYARFEFARGFESPLTAGALASFDFFGWSLALNTTGRGFLVSGRLPASGEGSAGGLQVSRYEDPQWRAAEPLEAGRNNLGVGVSHPPDPLAIDRCGNALVVWSSFEGGRHRVHANRFDASCR